MAESLPLAQMGKKDSRALHFPSTPALVWVHRRWPGWETSPTVTAQWLQFSQLVCAISKKKKKVCFSLICLPSECLSKHVQG